MPSHESRWIESAGGPLVMLPRSKRPEWKGVDSGDYDAACQVEEYLGVIAREWGDILVLGEEPFRTTWMERHDGGALLRWCWAPSEEELLRAASGFHPHEHPALESREIRTRDEPYVLFDGARGGAWPETGALELHLPPGVHRMRTFRVDAPGAQLCFILTCFERALP